MRAAQRVADLKIVDELIELAGCEPVEKGRDLIDIPEDGSFCRGLNADRKRHAMASAECEGAGIPVRRVLIIDDGNAGSAHALIARAKKAPLFTKGGQRSE